MDALSYILCLLVGVALPVGAFYVGVRRAWRQLAAAEAYREVSHRLGLSVDTRGVSVHGHLRDRRLWIGTVMTGYGSERKTEVRGVLSLARPLGLALHMRRRGAGGRFRRRSPELEIGDVLLDKRYEVHGDDLARVRTLLGAPAVRDAIHGLIEKWPRFVLTDHGVRVHLKRPETSARALEDLIGRMERLAIAIEERRGGVEAPDALRDIGTTWARLGEDLGLELEPSLPALSGQFEGRPLLLAIRREQEGYRISIRTWFHQHPELGLVLRPQTAPDGYWSVGQDIQVGDTDFDDAFVIKGWDPHIVRERLSAPVREGLLALTAVGKVDVNDTALTVRSIPLDHPALAETARAMCATATDLGW